LRVDHQVGRLEVTVNNLPIVRRCETVADLYRNTECFVLRESADASEEGREIFPFDEFHRDEVTAVDLSDIEDSTDIGMSNLPGQAHFVQEQFQTAMMARFLSAQKFERDRHMEFQVVRVVNDPHAAAAEVTNDTVSLRQKGARRQSDWSGAATDQRRDAERRIVLDSCRRRRQHYQARRTETPRFDIGVTAGASHLGPRSGSGRRPCLVIREKPLNLAR
jgi:hypothetical protein